ncbi:hypothetical protein CU009_2114 [Enterococcus faecium]|nr:hypothetical protein [Enterococcus faecium]
MTVVAYAQASLVIKFCMDIFVVITCTIIRTIDHPFRLLYNHLASLL